MPEPILHFMIPFSILVYFRRPHIAFIAGLLALTPDLDVFIFIHRYISHSFILILLISLPIIAIVYSYKPIYINDMIIYMLAIMSHVVMDIFTDYTPALWPLTKHSYYILLYIGIEMTQSSFIPYLKISMLTENVDFTPFNVFDAPIITGQGLIISIMLMLPILIKYLKDYLK